MTPEEHKRIVRAGLNKLSFNRPEKLDPVRLLMAKVQKSQQSVRALIQPIAEAGGRKDETAMFDLTVKGFLEEFKNYDKEEVLQLCVMLYAAQMMEQLSGFGGEVTS